MTYRELPAGRDTLKFTGEFLHKTDTDTGERLRWAELQLWRLLGTEGADAGRIMWLLYTIGHSLVYHEAGGCTKGVLVAARDFPAKAAEHLEDLEPCADCRPGDWRAASPDDQFDLEILWYDHTLCRTPEEVLRALSRCRNCRDKPHEGIICHRCGCVSYSEVLSSPGARLIERVKELDPAIAKAAARELRF